MEQNEVQGIKISQLDELTSIQDDDVLASVDTSEIKTTKVKASTLKSYINREVNEDISDIKENYAVKTSVPTKTSQLNNDSGFIDKSVNNLDNYYKKTEIDTKVQVINTTTNGLNTRLTTAEKNIETNKTDIKDLSNRTKRIETDIFDSGEASGTGINLQDSTLAEFQEVKVDGKSTQETTTGKQLFDVSDNKFSPSSSITYDDEGWITVNYMNTIDRETYVNVYTNISEKLKPSTQYNVILEVKDFTNSQGIGVVTISQQAKGQFATRYTISSSEMVKGKKYSKICTTLDNFEGCVTMLRTFLTFNPSGVMSNTITFRISVIEDISVTTEDFIYEPFTGFEPSPSPDYKQPIEVIEDDFDLVSCGTNLVNWSNIRQGAFGAIGKYENNTLTVTSENPQTYPAISYDITNILKRYENKKLKFICEDSYVSNEEASANVQMTVITNDGKTQYLPLYNIQTKNNTLQTILPNIKSAKIGVYASNSSTAVANTSTIVKPMLFIYDGEDENIEPYTETRQTITMPEGEFAGKIDDTYKDQFRINYNEQDGKYHLYLDKVVGKKVLNGSETWASLSDETKIRYYTGINNMNPINFAICDYFIKEETSNYFKPKTFRIAPNGAISFCYDNVMSLEQFKQWLSTHNTEVYYVLAEPYTLDLGVVNMPLSYYPITNVYNTCAGIPNMYVKYYRDFKKTITTMQVDIQELKSTIQELANNQTKLLSQINTIKENQVVEEESEVVTQ